MTNTEPPEDDAMEQEFWKNPPPPEGVIPQGIGPTEYQYVGEDGELIHGVVHGVSTYHQQASE